MSTLTLQNFSTDRLLQLRNKISENTADASEYNEYEQLLIAGGFTKEHIESKFQKANANDWDSFIRKRNSVKSFDEKKWIEVAVVASILAMSLALIISLAKTSKK
jgi:hypothetical protein